MYRQLPSELRLRIRVDARPLPSTLSGTILSMALTTVRSSTVRTIVSFTRKIRRNATRRVKGAQDGLQDVSIMMHQAGSMADAADKAAAKVAQADLNGRRLIDDGAVAYRVSRSVAGLEAACLRRASSDGWHWPDGARHLAGSDGHPRDGVVTRVRHRWRRR